MSAQLTMWDLEDQEKIAEALIKLDKIQRAQRGLFKKITQLSHEAETICAIVEDINHHQIYGTK